MQGSSAGMSPAVYSDTSTGTAPSDKKFVAATRIAIESQSPHEQAAAGKQPSDVNQTANNHQNNLHTDTPLLLGKVLLALPYIHCYKVQLAGREGTCIAAAGSMHSHSPIGVKAGEVIPPNSSVIVWKPRNSTLAYILAVLPAPLMSDIFNASDHIQQGGNSGPKKVEAYRNIPKAVKDAMGWVSQSSGRPMDGTNGEYVRMSETGIGLLIDSFQAYLRVNEACGLWLNYFDSYAKLAALSLDIQSYCEQVSHRYDEGELLNTKGYIVYPWEAIGAYSPLNKVTKTNDSKNVQLDKNFPFGLEEPSAVDQESIYRLTDTFGYLGQGFNRTLMLPAGDDIVRKTSDKAKDVGLYQELLSLDGSYSVRSAKSILLAKYPIIPVPKRIRLPEDAKGDDLTQDNSYKFSGQYGNGEEHKVNDWDTSQVSDHQSLLYAAGIQDLLAHHFNWKSTHPFFYHKKDFDYPDEGANESLSNVKFIRGKFDESFVSPDSPEKLNIDSRYGDVNYYNTASFISMLEDGSIAIGDGYGAQILMTGGQLRLESGGDIMLLSGSRVVTMAKESITRAEGSVDISSGTGDVRVKAENNLQILAGNSGQGGLLLESKGTGTTQEYNNRLGEDVNSSGITLLSRSGSVNTISQNIYIRSGVEEGEAEGRGSIILDCANGRSNFVSYASTHSFYNVNGLGVYHGKAGQEELNIKSSHFFGPSLSKINGPVVVAGSMALVDDGSLGVEGSTYVKGGLTAIGSVFGRGGKLGDSSAGSLGDIVTEYLSSYDSVKDSKHSFAKNVFKGSFNNFAWASGYIGNTTLLEDHIGFSFRDESETGASSVYGYTGDNFVLLETRWQQLQRNGLINDSSSVWQENPVSYQNKELMPWPGKKNWLSEEHMLQYNNADAYLLFDSNGHAKSRNSSQEKYETPVFNDWKKTKCSSSYIL